ncbi:MAG TPA: acyl carrier protein [Pyrinomonadaceae bacterium]|nr:acyl carrier protein [Pyrinomonadaceae bacterium]
MTTDNIRDEVKRAVSATAGIKAEDVPDHAAYREDLQLDSLTILEISVSLEHRFLIKIPDEELSSIRTIDDTVQAIRRHSESRTPCGPESSSQA